MIRVFITDDHSIVREGLRGIIEDCQDMIVCGEAAEGRVALDWLRENDNCCDVVLLDISMPGMDGLEVLTEIKKNFPGVAVLILTMHSEEQYALRVIRSGASGYLNKGSSADEMLLAIRNAAAGRKHIQNSLAEKMADALENNNDGPLHNSLSDREFQVMIMLARGRKIKEIAMELTLSPKTISTYQSRVLDKMGLESTGDLLRYAIQNGLVS
ncbi:MAG: response regulator transcription factor [Proteobacteria bacterium]|nr:response regulator transcription factor [Pseudomonadota bacterium]MBU1737602.1 response regulator transcription factor [Pseudomonadota bacterium]